MIDVVLALDLGTGGCKASLWTAAGEEVSHAYIEYPSFHRAEGLVEQRPSDWLRAVVSSTKSVLGAPGATDATVLGISVSGHSLGMVQLDGSRSVIGNSTPLWSDTRGAAGAAFVFERFSEREWYQRTGNGFPAALYPAFKAAWFRSRDADSWAATRSLVGSKDLVNLFLTGELYTDHSYASGYGVYSLAKGDYDDELVEVTGLPRSLLPDIIDSSDLVGTLQPEAARAIGLPVGIPVFAGGVDNACMALGSRGTTQGRVYASMGSSSWLTVTSTAPLLDFDARPFVFAHAIPGYFISALSTFSSGTTVVWLRDLLAPDLDIPAFLDAACGSAPTDIVMLPTLSGGTALEGGPNARGAILGLELGHTRDQIARAGLEGVAFALRRSLMKLQQTGSLEADHEILISGGGSRHSGWNQIFSDALDTTLVRTNVDQQAAALGAAAIAFVGLGVWNGYSSIDTAHRHAERWVPNPSRVVRYGIQSQRFDAATLNTISPFPTK